MTHTTANGTVQWMQAASGGKQFAIGEIPVTLKITGAASNGLCAVVEATLPPHHVGQPAHLHQQTTEVFYILNGVLAFTLGEETVIARPGSFICAKPGVAHRLWNPTAAPATYLSFQSPGGNEEYFVELAALLADEASCSTADPSQIEALGLKYDHFPA